MVLWSNILTSIGANLVADQIVAPSRTSTVGNVPAREAQNTGVSISRSTIPTQTTTTGFVTPARVTPARVTSDLPRAYPQRQSAAIVSGGSTASSGAGATGAQNNAPYWSDFSPFQLLADVYRNTFGNSYPVIPTGQQQIVPVPVGESGGNGGNSLMILLILAGAGFAVWYFYFRN